MRKQQSFLILTTKQNINGDLIEPPFPFGNGTVKIDIPSHIGLVLEFEQSETTLTTNVYGITK